MKKLIFTISTLFLLIMAPIFISSSFADAPPDPGEDPNGGGGTPVGGSPIGSGLIILTTLAIGYGAKKTYQFKQKNNNA